MANSVWKLNLVREGQLQQYPLFGGSSTKSEVVCFAVELLPGDEIYLSSPDSTKGYTSLDKAECGTEKTDSNHIRIKDGGTYDVFLSHLGVGKDMIRILAPTPESEELHNQQRINQRKLRNYKIREGSFTGLHNLLIFILAFIWIIPIIWLVLVSFSDTNAPAMSKLPWDSNWGWSLISYEKLFNPIKYAADGSITWDNSTVNMFGVWFGNTLCVAVFSCLVSTLFTVITAFCLSRLRFKGRKALMNISMILGLFPGMLTMICTYMLFQYVLQINLYNVRLIIAYSASSALGYLVAKGFFDTISMSIDEAARIDGANKLQTFFHITLPLSKPTIVYTVITSFMSPWVDFMFARIIMPSAQRENYTVAIGLYMMLDRENVNRLFGTFCAGAVIISIPLTILFMFVQKYYVAGVTGGAVKG